VKANPATAIITARRDIDMGFSIVGRQCQAIPEATGASTMGRAMGLRCGEPDQVENSLLQPRSESKDPKVKNHRFKRYECMQIAGHSHEEIGNLALEPLQNVAAIEGVVLVEFSAAHSATIDGLLSRRHCQLYSLKDYRDTSLAA
jgi:hypothetical protein